MSGETIYSRETTATEGGFNLHVANEALKSADEVTNARLSAEKALAGAVAIKGVNRELGDDLLHGPQEYISPAAEMIKKIGARGLLTVGYRSEEEIIRNAA